MEYGKFERQNFLYTYMLLLFYTLSSNFAQFASGEILFLCFHIVVNQFIRYTSQYDIRISHFLNKKFLQRTRSSQDMDITLIYRITISNIWINIQHKRLQYLLQFFFVSTDGEEHIFKLNDDCFKEIFPKLCKLEVSDSFKTKFKYSGSRLFRFRKQYKNVL